MEVQALLLKEGREVGIEVNMNNQSEIVIIYITQKIINFNMQLIKWAQNFKMQCKI